MRELTDGADISAANMKCLGIPVLQRAKVTAGADRVLSRFCEEASVESVRELFPGVLRFECAFNILVFRPDPTVTGAVP